MPRTLVVYYSRDGHTRKIAREIAAACGAGIEEIVDASGGAGQRSYLRSALEAPLHIAAAIAPPQHPPRPGDLVVIGTPIWCWNMSSPVRSYLRSQRAALGRVAFFCTFGGAGQDKVLRDMQTLCGREPLATLALTEHQCAAGHDGEVEAFVRALQGTTRGPHGPQDGPAPTVHRIRAGVQHRHSPS